MDSEILNDLDWLRSRKLNYQQFTDDDIGHIYDMIQSIVSHCQVPLKDDDAFVLDYRNKIKLAHPKVIE